MKENITKKVTLEKCISTNVYAVRLLQSALFTDNGSNIETYKRKQVNLSKSIHIQLLGTVLTLELTDSSHSLSQIFFCKQFAYCIVCTLQFTEKLDFFIEWH